MIPGLWIICGLSAVGIREGEILGWLRPGRLAARRAPALTLGAAFPALATPDPKLIPLAAFPGAAGTLCQGLYALISPGGC